LFLRASLILGPGRQGWTTYAPSAADGDGDDGERKDQKEHMAGEGDRLGAGNDRRLHEGDGGSVPFP
jgi:hypothetical protein